MTSKNLFALVVWLLVSTYALGLDDAVVSTGTLNVRSSPTGDVVDQINRDREVRIVRETREEADDKEIWAQIVYLNDDTGGTKFGWVARRFLDTQFSYDETLCFDVIDGEKSNCLATTHPDLQCQKSSLTNAYSSCSVSVRYEATNLTDESPDKVRCDATLEALYIDSKDWHEKYQSSVSSIDANDKKILMQFRLDDDTSVVDVRLRETNCSLSSI